jgi:Uma2 family endonuclease
MISTMSSSDLEGISLSDRGSLLQARIPHYWIINPEEGKILVFQEPNQEGCN